MNDYKCRICGTDFKSRSSAWRHKQKFHAEKDFEDEDSDNDDEYMSKKDEVEVIGDILKEVVEEIEEEEEEEEEDGERKKTFQSVQDMLVPDNYKNISKAFKNNVCCLC